MHFINIILRLRRALRPPVVILVAAVALCLTACDSKELTRSRAADVIRSSEEFKNPVTIMLRPEYRQSLALVGTGSQTTPKEEIALRRFLESHPDLAVLAHLGLVEFRVSDIQYPDSASSPVTVAASLTGAGRSASREWQQAGEGWTIPIARRELVNVTGLTGGEGESKQVRAEYTWRWQPVGAGTSFDTSGSDYRSLPESIRRNPGETNFADALRGMGEVTFFEGGKFQKSTATLQKYDDGWRMVGDSKTK